MIHADVVIQAFALPSDTRVGQRIPKKLLLEQGAPTKVDKRKIKEGIDTLHWIAALKPGNVALSTYRDETREYLELAVIHAVLRPKAKVARLLELIHRAIPYPLILMVTQESGISFSLVHKRFSQGEADKVVLDGEIIQEILVSESGMELAFLTSLALSRQNASDLYALYQGWLERLTALTTARLTGTFSLPVTKEEDEVRRNVLCAHGALEKKLTSLRAQAAKEKQLSRRVEMNLEIRDMQNRLDQWVDRLHENDNG